MKHILIKIIEIYHIVFSPIFKQLLGTQCRYEISCSQFALRAIRSEGVIKGSAKTVKRILSCQPFSSTKYEYI